MQSNFGYPLCACLMQVEMFSRNKSNMHEYLSKYILTNEPRHEKTCLCYMQTTMVQINLHILAVWSVPLLFAALIVWYL